MKKKFLIKDKSWEIISVPDNSEKLIMDGEKCFAQIFLRLRKIYINEELLTDRDALLDTIVHELGHAIIFTYAIDKRTFRDEEFICEFLVAYGKQITDQSELLCKFFIK